jgi:hypothetical protein
MPRTNRKDAPKASTPTKEAPQTTSLHCESTCRLTKLAKHLDDLAWVYEGSSPKLAQDLTLAAKILRRRAEQVGDEVCRSCGCAEFDPCSDDIDGECFWAEPGLCSAFSKTPPPNLSDAERTTLEGERHQLSNSFGLGPLADGQTRDRIAAIDAELGETP